jgi:N-acyl-D-aspartate/D-glutamate deacylase
MRLPILALLMLLLLPPAALAQAPYDLLLKGGRIVDGSGAPGVAGDVAIQGDRIVKVGGDIPEAEARRTIRIDGLVVAPGFIEPHAHISEIDRLPLPENLLRQGITTIVNSLHSSPQPAPLKPYLERLHAGPNTVWTAGHSWARAEVMGLANRPPTAGEQARMAALAREALDAGAIGLGTGLEYIPANYAATDEVIALAKAVARPGARYITHLRDEGAALLPAIDEAVAIGRASGLPVHVNHLKNTGVANWGQTAAVLDRLQAAGATFDVYPYTAYSTYSTVLFPSWALAGGPEAYRARIADRGTRTRLADEMLPIYRAQTAGRLDSVTFREVTGHPELSGRTLKDHVTALGRPDTLEAGIDALIDLQAGGGFLGIFEAMSAQDVERFLLHPAAAISSDGDLIRFGKGFPHPRSYGAYPRLLGRYVRERGVISLEAAVHKMTGVPAAQLGLADRGLLKPGQAADIVVFDPATIIDRATFADPHQYADGVIHLLVNGTPVLSHGYLTGTRPGRVLRLAEGVVR